MLLLQGLSSDYIVLVMSLSQSPTLICRPSDPGRVTHGGLSNIPLHRDASPQRPRFSTPHIISHYKGEEESAAVDFFGGNMTRVSEGGGEKNNKSRCPSGVALKVTQCGRGSFSLGKEKSGHSGFGTSCCDPKKQDAREPKYGFLMIGQQGASCAIAV